MCMKIGYQVQQAFMHEECNIFPREWEMRFIQLSVNASHSRSSPHRWRARDDHGQILILCVQQNLPESNDRHSKPCPLSSSCQLYPAQNALHQVQLSFLTSLPSQYKPSIQTQTLNISHLFVMSKMIFPQSTEHYLTLSSSQSPKPSSFFTSSLLSQETSPSNSTQL